MLQRTAKTRLPKVHIRDGLRPLPPTPGKESLDTQQLSVRLNFLLASEIGERREFGCQFCLKIDKITSHAFEHRLRNPKMTSQKLSKALPEMPGRPSEPPERSQPRPRALPTTPTPPFGERPGPSKTYVFLKGNLDFSLWRLARAKLSQTTPNGAPA